MAHVLLFDSDCLACSRAARAVAEMGITGLELRGLSDPETLARLRKAGLEPPAGPALLVGEGAEAHLATGWAMRRRLAGLMGWRRATRVAGLISIEARARVSRTAVTVTRRRLLGAGLTAAAGAVAVALVPGAASAATVVPDASTAPDAPGRLIKPTRAQVRSAMASPAVRSAIRHFGPIKPAWVAPGPPKVLVFTFDRVEHLWLHVDMSDVLIAIVTRLELKAVHYFATDGVELGSVSVAPHRRTVIHQAPAKGHNPRQVKLFLLCVGSMLDAPCIQTCEAAVDLATPLFLRLGDILQCFLCAGPKAIPCAKAHLV